MASSTMRKMLIIPFQAQFKGSEVDKDLKNKLKKERNGIFNFAIEGLQRLIKNDYEFTKSKKIDRVIEEYFENADPMHHFVKEMVVADSENRMFYEDLYNEYCKWLKNEGGTIRINRLQFPIEIKSRLQSNGIPFGLGNSKSNTNDQILAIIRLLNSFQ